MSEKPVVGIVMGSDSDWDTMEGASERLRAFEIDYEVQVMSAHRSPKAVMQYASSARRRGLAVIIAGAGGAAHLAGVRRLFLEHYEDTELALLGRLFERVVPASEADDAPACG